MESTKDFQSFFKENYTDNDVFGFMSIPNRKRTYSKCYNGRVLRRTKLDNEDAYMTYNTLQYTAESGNIKKTVKRDKNHVRRLMFCYADLDTYHIAPAGIDMDTFNEGIIQELEKNCFKWSIPVPTYIIASGRGLNLFWKVDEHVKAYPRWQKVQKFLHEKLRDYGSDGAVTTDSSRVFRVLGSTNSKSGKQVRLLRNYGEQYTLHQIIAEYLPVEEPVNSVSAEKKYIFVLEDGQRLFMNRIRDLKALLKKYRDKEEGGYRENILFLYRYYYLCLYKDKQAALKAVLKLNSALSHPLSEKEAARATASAEKYFDSGCSFAITNKNLIKFLNIQPEEMDVMLSFPTEDKLRSIKKKSNRATYLNSLKKSGKKTAAQKRIERRQKMYGLLQSGKTADDIMTILGISRATFYADKKVLDNIAAALKRTRNNNIYTALEHSLKRSADEIDLACGDSVLPITYINTGPKEQTLSHRLGGKQMDKSG